MLWWILAVFCHLCRAVVHRLCRNVEHDIGLPGMAEMRVWLPETLYTADWIGAIC